MDAGLAVVLAVLGAFLLVPLWLAWVSTDPRRWARIEGVLGRELNPKKVPSWLWWVWIGFSALYVIMGVARLLGRFGGPDRWLGAAWVLQGTIWGFLCGWYYRQRRQEQAAARSAQTQVQDRAEPGRPGAGG
jgi:hypothetical protein